MIRNAVIHITNEQPLLADLYEMPTASDASLVCTNIRMLDGKKPIFIDNAKSIFVFISPNQIKLAQPIQGKRPTDFGEKVLLFSRCLL